MNEKQKAIDRSLEKIMLGCIYVVAMAMPFSIALTETSLGLALSLWMIRLLVTKGTQVRRLSLEWAFLAFIGAEILAMLFSTNGHQSFIYSKRLLVIPVVYLIANNVRSDKPFQRIVYIFILSISLYSLLGIITYFLSDTVRVRHIQNSMTTGGITMMGALACFTQMAILKKNKWRHVSLLCGITNSACLLLTSTRSSWLGFFIGLLAIIFFTNRRLFIMVPIVIGIFYFLTPRGISYHVQNFFDPTWGTNAERLVMWQVGWKIFKNHPLVGIGDVDTQEMFRYYAPLEMDYGVGHFHSNYIHIAVTLGSIGFLAYLYMIVKIFQALFRVLSKTLGERGLFNAWALTAVAVFFAFHVNGFFEWNFGDAEIITMVFFITGLALAIPQTGTHAEETGSITHATG